MEAIIARKFHTLRLEWNERQRRLWAASEAMCLGHGGISIVARATGLSRPTILKGIKELKNNKRLTENRVRREGSGRKKATQKQPGLLPALDALVEPTAKGDPMSPLRWTTHSTQHLSEALNEQGFDVSKTQVFRLLHELEYQLAANRKSLEGGTNPDRNTQFEFINAQVAEFLKQGCPVISVDAKKKVLIGNDRQNGRVWRPKGDPELVKVYDFIDKELGKATPYGIYDLQKNVGWVNVGIDHDTAEFAVESIRRWYKHLGRELYPNAKDLFITADGGGSNSSRSRLWKFCLQEFADESGLTIFMSHFPPGTNKIEHRLFNHISMNWKGQPLTSLDVIINLIGHTTSSTGLKVDAMEDRNIYPTKRKITNEQLNALNIIRNDVLGKWNYKISQRIS
ncbi:MAG: ISAzo13 family transposase [Planctomycetaceae bacterium]|nr:ISAzo13 family transposase [Planctomycetaceae bacterium]